MATWRCLDLIVVMGAGIFRIKQRLSPHFWYGSSFCCTYSASNGCCNPANFLAFCCTCNAGDRIGGLWIWVYQFLSSLDANGDAAISLQGACATYSTRRSATGSVVPIWYRGLRRAHGLASFCGSDFIVHTNCDGVVIGDLFVGP